MLKHQVLLVPVVVAASVAVVVIVVFFAEEVSTVNMFDIQGTRSLYKKGKDKRFQSNVDRYAT